MTIKIPLLLSYRKHPETIGDRFKELGYATGWFGKSHLGYLPQYHPLRRGFDEYFGFLGGAHDYLDAAGDKHNPILRGTTPVNEIDYTTDAFGREAVAFIEKHRAEPWLCYLAFNAVHAPLESTEKYLSRFPNIEARKRRTFAAMLSAMDDAVGSVLDKLREHRLEENTLIFFISDNGGPTRQTTSGNGPLRGFKAQTWEGGIRVPWIIQWKGHIAGGRVDDRPVIQLYNLQQDIGEKENLADKEPEKLKALAAAWEQWNRELVDPAWRPGPGAAGKKAGKGKRKAQQE